MCLAVPGRLVEVFVENGLRMGRVDFAGTRQVACLEYVPEAGTGHFVMVHAGFAISVVDEEEARKTLDIWREFLEAAAGESGGAIDIPPDQARSDDPGGVETE